MNWRAPCLLLVLLACQGTIMDPDNGPDGPGPGGTIDTRFDARVWLLAPAHYETEATRLFGDGVPTPRLAGSAPQRHLTDIAANGAIDTGNINDFHQASTAIADWVMDENPGATRCGDATAPSCADEVLGWLPAEAFRRAPTADERSALRGLYDELAGEYDHDHAMRGLIRAILMSPQFLYRSELGEGRAETVELTDHEVATLLSFAITDRGPDAEILAAADRGELSTADQREAQARRLMAQSGPMWRRFFWEWLHMATLQSQGEEVGLDPMLVQQMREEYDEFVQHIVVDERGTLRDLLTESRTWARPELAAHYGASHPGGGVEQVALDPSERAGLLTQMAWLVSHSKRGRANVVRRGMSVFIDAMCFNVSQPDIDLEEALAELVGPDATVEEIAAARSADPTCGNCHRLSDPIGLVFENFASDGTWQTTYADGNPVLTDVVIDDVGAFDNPADVSRVLADDTRFQRCLVQRLTHFMVGVDVGSPQSIAWPAESHEALVAADGSFEELLVAIVRHPAFVERTL